MSKAQKTARHWTVTGLRPGHSIFEADAITSAQRGADREHAR
jgi:hypothetical protein